MLPGGHGTALTAVGKLARISSHALDVTNSPQEIKISSRTIFTPVSLSRTHRAVPERVLSRTLLTFGPAGRAAPGLRRWEPMANAHEILEKMMNERKLAEVFEGWVQSMRSELKHRTIDEVREAFEPVELYQRLDGTRGFTVRFKQTGEVFSVDFEAEWLH
jgi:hypothetical protein